MAPTTPNARLHAWRLNAGLPRAETAKMINLTATGVKHHLAGDEERVRRWEAGEVAGRPAALRLAGDIAAIAPINLRREARDYTAPLGVLA